MKAMLRLNAGILTKSITIPDSCLRTDFRLPFKIPMTAKMAGDIHSAGASFNTPCLVFKWDGRSVWGSKDVKDPIFILDLVDASIF